MLGLYEAYKKAFYTWIRQRMRPLSIEEAEEKKLFWAKMYALVSCTGLGILTYQAFKGDVSLPLREDLPKNVATALTLTNNQSIRFISYKGFEKVADFKYSKEELQNLANSESQSPESKSVSHSHKSTVES